MEVQKELFVIYTDATIAFFLVLLKGQSGEPYNVGGNEPFEISILELAETLVKLFPEYNLNVIKNERISQNG